MTAWGRGLFFLYIYIENFQNLLIRNQWTNFNITWQECFFGDPLTIMIRQKKKKKKKKKKTWPLGGGSYFPYISILKTLKIFLSATTGPTSR